jgi:hypothetical protein
MGLRMGEEEKTKETQNNVQKDKQRKQSHSSVQGNMWQSRSWSLRKQEEETNLEELKICSF